MLTLTPSRRVRPCPLLGHRAPFVLLLLLGCSEADPSADAGRLDAAGLDAAGLDAGGLDASARGADAGDGGPPDAGQSCEAMPDGTGCGVRRECRDGACVFTEPDTPCDYDLAAAPAGAFLVIACDHDLGGATVALASGITLEYRGGSITNGALVTDDTSINGELLNLSLAIDVQGSSALISPTFVLRNARWGLVEGMVDGETAINNREHLNAAIQLVSELAGEVFEIGALDAYLDVGTGPFAHRSLRLPSNFHLRMSDDTHLRVQANNNWEYSLIVTQNTENVRISGGHLWGDRFSHDYDSGSTRRHDQGLGIYLLSAHNVLVENLSADQFTGDGLVIGSSSLRNEDGSPREGRQYAEDVTIRGCSFDQNRRNGVALTDIDGAVLENLTITRTALGDPGVDGGSAGTSPRAGVQIEPITRLDAAEVLLQLQIVRDVRIRDCSFDGNFGADITLHHSDLVEIYNNRFGGSTSAVSASGVHLHDNVYVADRADRRRGISVPARQRASGYHVVREWNIHDNSITGYDVGISIGGVGHQVRSNRVEDFRLGIFLGTNLGIVVEDNQLSTARESSRGYLNLRGGQRVVTGVVRGGSVVCTGQPLRIVDVNNEVPGGERLLVEDITFTSTSGAPVYVEGSSHVTVERCTADAFQQTRSTDVLFVDNTVR